MLRPPDVSCRGPHLRWLAYARPAGRTVSLSELRRRAMSATGSARRGWRESFAHQVVISEDAAAAAQVIVEHDWQSQSDALACAVSAAAELSARRQQPPERFAEILLTALSVADVPGASELFALARTLMPNLDHEQAEIRVAFAQWHYLLAKSSVRNRRP